MDTITVAELLDEWFACKRPDLAVTTKQTTVGAIRFLKRDFGAMTIDALKVRHIDRWFAQMNELGYSRAYAKRIIGVLSAAHTKAVAWDLAATNPVKAADKPKVKSKVRPPTPAVVKKALDHVRRCDPLLFLFIRVDAVTGARRSEILGLGRDVFDPDLPATGRVCGLSR